MTFKKGEIDNWVTFSQNYLNMARLGCLEMLNNKFRDELKMGYVPHFTEKDLFIPTLYNIKHGIEVFIKTLKFTLAEKLSEKDIKHNILNLFCRLKEEIKQHKREIKKVFEQELKKDEYEINLNIAQKDFDKIPEYLDKIEKLVIKYYHCEFIKREVNDAFQLEDTENTLFRYPENTVKIKIDYEKVIVKIDSINIKELLKDVEELQESFNDLGFIFYVYKKYSSKT